MFEQIGANERGSKIQRAVEFFKIITKYEMTTAFRIVWAVEVLDGSHDTWDIPASTALESSQPGMMNVK